MSIVHDHHRAVIKLAWGSDLISNPGVVEEDRTAAVGTGRKGAGSDDIVVAEQDIPIVGARVEGNVRTVKIAVI